MIEFTEQIYGDFKYKIVDEVVYINHLDKVYKVDFSNLENGVLDNNVSFIVSAKKEGDVLFIELFQPVDKNGIELNPTEEFDISEFIELEIEWKSQTEIDVENNTPKPPTEKECIEALEQALLDIILGGADND